MPTRPRIGPVVAFTLALLVGSSTPADERPNIVYILADDLGYGDVRAFNSEGKIPTPNIDRLAREGMRFTDAHSGSAVCTPTRYGILTGRYAWRSRLKSGVLGGYSPHLIEPDRATVASLLKQHGYRTACVGKWHLGFDWATTEPTNFGDAIEPKAGMRSVDYARPFRNGPTTLGFDTFFGISASLDMPPYVFLKDDRAASLPTTEKTWIRKGPAAEDFEAVDVLPKLVEQAIAFIRADRDRDRPSFLYLPLTAPHTPIVPDEHFAGTSKINDYADFVMQVDAAVGRVLQAVEPAADRTLVIFTSDNGCSPSANFAELREHGHNPSGPFRGTKADIFEGGHRIPFVARWPGKIAAGSTCTDTICLTDLLATCAAIVGATLPADAGEDSVNLLPALLGRVQKPLREATVHHSINGSFAIRQGSWKLCLCPDSGGWSAPRPGSPTAKGLPPVQLYNLEADLGERQNVAADHPDAVDRLTRLLERYVAEGRSTPGAMQANEGEVVIQPGEEAR